MTNEYESGIPTYIAPPSFHLDPCCYFLNQSEEVRANHMIIDVAASEESTITDSGENKNVRILSVMVPNKEPIDSYSDDLKKILEDIIKLLHHVFVSPNPNKGRPKSMSLESLKDLENVCFG